jgi:drug/metabolite transporter (DMT)-like permease
MNDRAAEPTQTQTPSPVAVATAFLLIYLSWGTTYRATGYAMQDLHMPPALFGGTRLLLAGAILLVYQFGRGQSLSLTRRDCMRLLPISICLFPMGNLFINLGQQKVPSGVAAILIATTPLWIGFLGILWPGGERLSWRGWLGLTVGFAGIVLALEPEVQDGFSFTDDFRYLLVLASAASWALGSLFSRHLPADLPHLTSAGYQMILGGIFQCAIGTGFGEWPDFVSRFTPGALYAYLYLLIVGSLTGFIAFNWLLGHIAAAKVGTYAYVNPVIAVFIGMITGEPIDNWEVFVGFAIILAGVYLVRGDHVPSKEIELEPD